jgi:hypothetical protein
LAKTSILFLFSAAAGAAACLSPPALGQEAFVGVYAHGVDTPFSLHTGEGGTNFAVGYRFPPLQALSVIGEPEPYVVGALNMSGDASFAGAGISWSFSKGALYVRPAIALVVHNGPDHRLNHTASRRTELGSRVVFEPEISVGYSFNKKLALEASWMHLSHARLFNSKQNPGIDMVGARLNVRR